MRFLISLLVLIYTLPSQAQEVVYCVTSLSELTSEIKKKSKPLLYYPEFGEMGLYLTVKFGKSTYYLETKYANIEYDTRKKTLTAVCSGTRNCILSGKITAPNRQPKMQLATLKRASKSDLQCYAGYINQQIRRLKYSRPTANLSINKKKTSPYKTSEKDKSVPSQLTNSEKEKLLTVLEDDLGSALDHEIAFQKFKGKALSDFTSCLNTLSKIFEIFTKEAKAGNKDSFRKLFVSLQPMEEKARQHARNAMQHIRNGQEYAKTHNVRENKWVRLNLDSEIRLESVSKKQEPFTQTKVNKMNDEFFGLLLRTKVTQLEILAKGAESIVKELK